jgi:hypothetical protein
MRERIDLICPTRQAEYFSDADWTGVMGLNAWEKSVFWRGTDPAAKGA